MILADRSQHNRCDDQASRQVEKSKAMKTVLKAYLRSKTTLGLRNAFRLGRYEWNLCRLHRQSLKKVSRFLQPPVKLNLGCGKNSKKGWINIDLFERTVDLQLDLREPWPFRDGVVSYIYSEHLFEHLEFHEEVPRFLAEALRVLEPGGVFDVVVPDTELPLKAYGDPNASYWTSLAKRWHPEWCQTQLDHINYHFRQDGDHEFAWDFDTLARTLKSAGFQCVGRREFNPRMDSKERELGSLYMTGTKPQ
jgi:SAM-dependent methyltransferase